MASTPTINIIPNSSINPTKGGPNGSFTINDLSGSAPTGGLTVNFDVTGSNFANNTPNYTLIDGSGNTISLTNVSGSIYSGSITIPYGQTSTSLTVQTPQVPQNTQSYAISNPNEAVTVSLIANNNYTLNTFGNTATSFTVGSTPRAVAVGDFTGDGQDGIQSLATANYGSNNVSVLLGNGKSGFGAATNYTVGSQPVGVAIGDFNGDGNQDIAVANYQSGSVSVLLNNGSGSFGTATNFTLSYNPIALATGDFTNSGKNRDVVTANPLDGSISLLLGNGSGGFTIARSSFSVGGTNPVAVVVGDFNGDGKQDVATANYASNNVSVLLGDGTGKFGTATTFTVGSNPIAIAEGHLEGTSKPLDLVTANEGNGTVSVLIGSASGTFTPDPNGGANGTFTVGTTPVGLAIGDFNGDGKLDIATLNNDNTISVLLGDGTGNFSAATTYSTGITAGLPSGSLTAGDFNSNGSNESLVFTTPSGNTVSTLLNVNAGKLTLLNHSPSLATPSTETVNVNSTLSIAGVSINADTSQQLTLALSATNGKLNLSTSNINVASGANNSSTITLTGSLANLNTDLKTLTYTANPNYKGADNINLIVNEPGGTSLDGTLSAKAAIAVNVSPSLTVGGNNATIDNGNFFGSLLFNLASNLSNTATEVGVFAVSDDAGDINTPTGQVKVSNTSAYIKAALGESQILYGFDPVSLRSGSYQAQSQLFPNLLTNSSINNNGNNLGFYVVTNGTANQKLAALAGQTSIQPNVFFSFSAANSDSLSHLQVVNSTTATNQFTLNLNSSSGSGTSFQPLLSGKAAPTNTSDLSQGIVRPIIDTKTTNTALTVNFTVTSDALFSDFVGFYQIKDSTGTLLDGTKPGAANYAQDAVSQVLSNLEFDKQIGSVNTNLAPVYNPADQPWQITSASPLTYTFAAGSYYAPVLIANGNVQSFLADNPNNNPPSDLSTNSVGALPIAYFAFLKANSDGIDHIRSLPGYTLGFKDYYGGGDLDYNDMVLNFSNTSNSVHPTSQAPTY